MRAVLELVEVGSPFDVDDVLEHLGRPHSHSNRESILRAMRRLETAGRIKLDRDNRGYIESVSVATLKQRRPAPTKKPPSKMSAPKKKPKYQQGYKHPEDQSTKLDADQKRLFDKCAAFIEAHGFDFFMLTYWSLSSAKGQDHPELERIVYDTIPVRLTHIVAPTSIAPVLVEFIEQYGWFKYNQTMLQLVYQYKEPDGAL
jgi:hypothetical protein